MGLARPLGLAVVGARIAFVVVGILLAAAGAWAAQAGAELSNMESEFSVRQWTSDDGLPQNVITSIAQSRDGYLWLGTLRGLVRFDGVRFRTFDLISNPEMGHDRIVDLFCDSQDRLWIRTEFGGLTLLEHGTFARFGGKDGVKDRTAGFVTADRKGGVWMGTSQPARLLKYDGSRWVSPDDDDSRVMLLGGETISSLAADTSGEIYGHSPSIDGLIRLWPAPAQVLPFPGTRKGILALFEGAERGLWVAGEEQLWRFEDGNWTEAGNLPRGTEATVGVEDRSGAVWLGTRRSGIVRVQGGNAAFLVLDRPGPGSPIIAAFEDREGNLWFGTDGDGLFRVRRRFFRSVSNPGGLRLRPADSLVRVSDGQMVVFQSGTAFELAAPGWEPVVSRRLSITDVRCALIDSTGALWVGTGSEGMRVIYPDGKQETLDRPQRVTALAEDQQHRIWIGTPTRIHWMEGGVRRRLWGGREDLDEVTAMTVSKSGSLYAGLRETGLLCIQGTNGFRRFNKADGLPSERILALYSDAEDRLWIGTQGSGLCLFENGRFFPCPESRLPRVITAILEDDQGCLWLGTSQGIWRASLHQLEQRFRGMASSVSLRHFGVADGLPSGECSGSGNPRACKTSDGRLWFSTVRGLAEADPARLPTNTFAPPILIEEVLIDDDPLSVRPGEFLRVPAGNRRVEIRYTGISLSAPEAVQFRYRLEGLDRDWTEAGATRSAYFQGLRPGKYRFRVIAGNNEGVWSETEAFLNFSVAPFFWQRSSFQIAAALAGCGLLLAGFRARIGRLQRLRRQQQDFSRKLIASQEAERARIASDLHDSLEQELLVIKNRADLALMASAAEPAAAQLRSISGLAMRAIDDVRGITQALRPKLLDRLGITRSIRSLAEGCATDKLKISCDLDPLDGLLAKEQEINLYRIVQESLANALKHSNATELQLSIRHDGGLIHFEIADNGRGFDTENLSEVEGLGLQGLKERAGILGGRLEIIAKPGHGTRIIARLAPKRVESSEP